MFDYRLTLAPLHAAEDEAWDARADITNEHYEAALIRIAAGKAFFDTADRELRKLIAHREQKESVNG